MLSLTAEDKDTFKFINSFLERDKIFFRSFIRPEMYTEGQVVHKFISKEQLNLEIQEMRNKQRLPTEAPKQLSPGLGRDVGLMRTSKDVPQSLVDIFLSSHGVAADGRTASSVKGNYGRTFVDNIVGKPGQPQKTIPAQETGPLGMLYLFAQIEPAYYLVVTKCIMPKDIKHFQDAAN